MKWIETDSLSNQNIATALAIGSYIADADRSIICEVSLDQIQGNGDYIFYITKRINGAGSSYVYSKLTHSADVGETAIGDETKSISVRSGDVLTAYVVGLATDTTTVDTTVRWFDESILDEVIEGTLTFKQSLRIIYAVLFGKSTGGGTASVTFRDIGDTKARVSATVDANGNRTVIVTDGTP